MQKEIMRFWTWFISNKSEFSQINEANYPSILEKLNEKIILIDPDLLIELRLNFDTGHHTMIISAGGIRDAFPAVRETVEKSPVLSNWNFVAFRQRIQGNILIDFHGSKLHGDNIFFEHENTDDGKLGIIVYVQDFEEDMIDPLYLLLDSFLGEYDVETKLSYIEFEDIEAIGENALPLKLIAAVVDEFYKKDLHI